jgi:ABC-2 type transport system permease protein
MGLVVMIPIVFVLVFGYGIGVKPTNIKTAYIDDDQPTAWPDISNKIVDLLSQDQTVSLVNATSLSLAEAENAVRSGEYTCVIYFPANFSHSLLFRTVNVTVTILIDNSNPQLTQAVLSSINLAIGKQSAEGSTVKFETTYVYGDENMKAIDYMAPAIISFAIMIISMMLSIVMLVRERREGTIERVLASPTTKLEIVLGYMFAFTIIAAVQSTIILGLTVVFFDLTIRGSILLAYLIIVLFAMGSLSMGIALSVLAKSELQAVQFVPMIIFPSIILGGLLIPIETMPSWLQVLAAIIPMTYPTRALRNIMVKGLDIAAVSGDIVALAAFLAIMIFLAVRTFREEL